MRTLVTRNLVFSVLAMILFVGRSIAGQWPLEIYEVMDDKKIVVFVGNEDIAASPEWRPAEGGPPLTIDGALQHLKRWIANDDRLAGAEVREIELKPIHGHEKENRWYYLLQLRTENGAKSQTNYAVILLNGKVISAVAEPASVK